MKIEDEVKVLDEATTKAIKQVQKFGKAQRDMAQHVDELNQQIANIQDKIKEQVSDQPSAMEWLQREKETMRRFQDKLLSKRVK